MPADVRDFFGHALSLAQKGRSHKKAKPLAGFKGTGAVEVVDIHNGNVYHAVYTARYASAIYVLHCFKKKAKKDNTTPKRQIDLIKVRMMIAAALDRSDWS